MSFSFIPLLYSMYDLCLSFIPLVYPLYIGCAPIVLGALYMILSLPIPKSFFFIELHIVVFPQCAVVFS